MENRADAELVLRELVLRVAALEENVAFLEVWCEEQQDALDRVECWYYEDDGSPPETERERKVRQLRARITRLRHELVEHDPAAEDSVGAGAGAGVQGGAGASGPRPATTA